MVARADWSDSQKRRLVRLYKSGRTIAQCGKLLQAGQVVILRYLKECGIQSRPAKKQGWSAKKIARCVALYESGKTQAQIAEILQAGQAHVCKILAENQIVPRGRWTPERIQEMIELYQSGVGLCEVARKMQTNQGHVRKYLRRNKIVIRSQIFHSGQDHGNWKGGRVIRDGGYIHLRRSLHPYARDGYVAEHRLVMEKHLGRYLLPSEVVHHKDKNRKNNALENLELFPSNAAHLAHELKGQTPKWSEDGKSRIDQGLAKLREGQRTRRLSKIRAQRSLAKPFQRKT